MLCEGMSNDLKCCINEPVLGMAEMIAALAKLMDAGREGTSSLLMSSSKILSMISVANVKMSLAAAH